MSERDEMFWNMKQVIAKHGHSYVDWEGMASSSGLKKLVRAAMKPIITNRDDPEIKQVLGDLLLHYAYESKDQAGIVPTEETLIELAYIMYEVLTTKEWMKSGTKW